MVTQRTMTGSALLTAALLTGVLALITGILGMHVTAGPNSAHSAVAVSSGLSAATGATSGGEASGHVGHPATTPDPAGLQELSGSNGAASPAQCSCSGDCSSQHSMSASCIPSVTAGGLAAPVPDDTVSITGQSAASTTAARVPWSYRPGGPSPGELSISRT